jgi:hypothetical protein
MSAAMSEDGQDVVELAEHRVVGEAHDLHSGAPQVCFSCLILGTKLVVHPTINFDDEAQVCAIEVRDIAHDDVLATELPSPELAAAKRAPESRLCLRRMTAHLPAQQNLYRFRTGLL